MGYEATYFIKFLNLKEYKDEDLDSALDNISYCVERLSDRIDPFFFEDYYEIYDTKWYDFDKEFLDLSKLEPNLKVEVDVYGEYTGDISRHYFYQGKHQVEKAIILFKESKLWQEKNDNLTTEEVLINNLEPND